jgi:hypothetical protein
VVKDSHSSYTRTTLSVSSTLNLNFIQDDLQLPRKDLNDLFPANAYYLRPRLLKFLIENGYETRILPGGYRLDDKLNPKDMILQSSERIGTSVPLTAFNLTPIHQILTLIFGKDRSFLNPYYTQRERVLGHFGRIAGAIPGGGDRPLFLYAHFMLPHTPFTFDANGEIAKDSVMAPFGHWDGGGDIYSSLYAGSWMNHYKTAYVPQLQFTNSQILKLLDEGLTKEHGRPRVIFVLSDHGSRMKFNFGSIEGSDTTESYNNFLAVYFSDRDYSIFPQALQGMEFPRDLSSINLMRIMLNKYFGENLPMLPNRQFFSPWGKPYELVDVTGIVRKADEAP